MATVESATTHSGSIGARSEKSAVPMAATVAPSEGNQAHQLENLTGPKASTNLAASRTPERSPLVESFLNIAKSAILTNPRVCIQRAILSACETIGDLAPTFLVPTAVFSFAEKDYLTATIAAVGAISTHVAGSYARLTKKITTDSLTRALSAELESQHHLQKQGMISHLGEAGTRRMLEAQQSAIRHVEAATASLFELAGLTAGMVMTTAALLVKSPLAAGAILLSGTYYAVVEFKFAKKAAERDSQIRDAREIERRASRKLQDPTIEFSPNQLKSTAHEFTDARRAIVNIEKEAESTLSFHRTAGLPLSVVAVGIAGAAIAGLISQAAITAQSALTTALLLLKLNSSLQNLVLSLGTSATAAGRGNIYFIMKEKLASQVSNEPGGDVTEVTLHPGSRVTFDGVTVSGPTASGTTRANGATAALATSRPLLDDIHLSLETGTVTCIKGQDGSGKTRILELLCGRATPSSGCIHIDEIPLKSIHHEAADSLIKFFPSDPKALAGKSVMEVMTEYGGTPTPAQVRSALSRFGIRHFFKSVQDLHRPLGRDVSQGIPVTEGVLKKILLIASQFSKAQIVLIDDPGDELSNQQTKEYVRSLKNHAKKNNRIIVVTTRDDEVVALGDYRFKLEQGSLSQVREKKRR
jgi:ABC-type multidrug transport system fused ATPase/permease subunit